MANFAARQILLSASLAEARRNALTLYRDYLKYIPILLDDYNIDVPADYAKSLLRHEFEKNSLLRDPAVIDLLVFRGRCELDEMQHKWKQRTHVMKHFEQYLALAPDDELHRFLVGVEDDFHPLRDEELEDREAEGIFAPQIYPHKPKRHA